ncbi:hypothetical protein [Desulfosporosinus sp. FKA]|uniref:hypothetical protein n=1 Tax=Desulfosporosinus sp. FKA TaxID=1969834 RepID=UPI000B499205|nr:hypothetical protein [Desulfosporosinus sp. FKA]
MNIDINKQCLDISEKMSINLTHFTSILELSQQLESKSLDTEVELFNELLERRQGLINEIDQVNQELKLLQSSINQKIGLENFNLDSIQSYIPENLFEQLNIQYNRINDVIQQIQDLDKEYTKKTEMEREAAKLKLLRFKSTLRQGQSYQNAYKPEARFIDKQR